MPATVRVDYFGANASEPGGVSAESGITFNREDTQTGTTPIPVPSATGTNYSWHKCLALKVTTAAATSLSNRKVGWTSGPTTGLYGYFKGNATYTQPTSGNKPADSGSNDATPATWTKITTTPQVYHSGSVSANSTGRNGDFCQVLFGVDNNYAGGGGSASLPNLQISYDEA